MKQLPIWMHNSLNRTKRVTGAFMVWYAEGVQDMPSGAWWLNFGLLGLAVWWFC